MTTTMKRIAAEALRRRMRERRASSAAPEKLPAATLLQLMRLASPALPVGGFSYSEGLEALVQQHGAATENVAVAWLTDMLHLILARGDLAVLAQAIQPWRRNDRPRIAELNQWVLQTRESSEFRAQTVQMGRSLIEWLRNDERPQAQVEWLAACEPTYPVAFALALAPTGVSVHDGLIAFSSGWAENVVQAAMKSVPLGQLAGQRMLAKLAAEIPAAVEYAIALPDEERQAFSPMLAILSSQHEVQYSRLFRS